MKNFAYIALLPLVALTGSLAVAQDAERPSYTDASAESAPVADAYFEAYTTRDWDSLEPLLSENSSFDDPTATYVFGSILSQGRDAIMERFRVGYAGLTHMKFAKSRRFVAGDTAVYEGDLDWGIEIGGGTKVSSVTPMVIVLTVSDGKVISHRDFLDYAPFLEAVSAARTQ